MKKSYHHYLNRNYLNDLFKRIITRLKQGDCVCVSILEGCGETTFLNFFLRLVREDKLFGQIYYFDAAVESKGLLNFIRTKIPENNQEKLLIIRSFEDIENKQETLEKLNNFKRPHPKRLIFLVITDHTGISHPEQYLAKTTPFFSERFQIIAFNEKNTKETIINNCQYFGWEVEKAFYEEIYRLSGGMPILVRHICRGLAEDHLKIKNVELFKKDPSVLFQLNYITRLLIRLTRDQLLDLGLVDDKGKIRSSLLRDHFHNYQVELASRLHPNLSFREAKVFSYFYENEGRVITIDKIADLMEMSDLDYSLWAVYKLISRIKRKIKNNFEIINIKSQGYILRPKRK
jgi:hypothetical protein